MHEFVKPEQKLKTRSFTRSCINMCVNGYSLKKLYAFKNFFQDKVFNETFSEIRSRFGKMFTHFSTNLQLS